MENSLPQTDQLPQKISCIPLLFLLKFYLILVFEAGHNLSEILLNRTAGSAIIEGVTEYSRICYDIFPSPTNSRPQLAVVGNFKNPTVLTSFSNEDQNLLKVF
jgi:hypothetical protein